MTDMTLDLALKHTQENIDRGVLLRDTILGLQKQHTDDVATIKARDLTIVDLNSQLAKARATVDELTTQLGAANAKIVTQQHELDEDTAQIGLLTRQVADLKQQLAECEEGHDDPPVGKTKFGAFAGVTAGSGETKAQARARVCAAYGVATLPIERIYNEGTWTAPPAAQCVVSFSFKPDVVLSGSLDAQITAYVKALPLGIRYGLCLNHECDNPAKNLDPAQQRDATAHFADVVRAVGNPDVLIVPILMAWTIMKGDWESWLPDPSKYDWFGSDAYYRPTGPNTTATVYQPCLDAAAKVGKPLFIGETSLGAVGKGGTGFTEDQWTQLVGEAVAFLNRPEVAGVCFFEVSKSDGDWRLENHPAALDAWKAAVAAS